MGMGIETWNVRSRMDLGEMGWEVVGWMHVAQDRDQLRALVNSITILRVP
jgi:hypothetical protein